MWKPKLCVEASRPEKSYGMYTQTFVKKRKKARSPLETEAGAVSLVVKEEDIVDGIKPVASLTLSKREKTSMSKLI